jgi:hypothetical protein
MDSESDLLFLSLPYVFCLKLISKQLAVIRQILFYEV